ncbi:MAG: LysR substrate-binding domain-containing protein [Pseudomonadota bacterium]
MDSLTSLRVFLKVASSGSFAAAARSLDLSTSATSKSIARLEEELGVKLFNRTTRSVALTPEGERLREGARPLVAEIDALREEITSTMAAPSGRLTISAPTAFGRIVLMPMLRKFWERYPKVQLNLRFEDKLADIVDERVDVAIRAGDLSDSATLVARHLFDDQLVICAAPEYLEKRGWPIRLEELGAHDCLIFRNRGSGRAVPWFLGNADTPRLAPHPAALCDDGEGVSIAAAAGLGIAQMPHYMAKRFLDIGSLVEILDAYRPAPTAFHVVFAGRRLMPSRVRVFIDSMAEAAKEL